jgi:hypothetical protein
MIKKILLFPFTLFWMAIKGLFRQIWKMATTSQNEGGGGALH